jgi:hypothetical protein
MDCGTGWPSLDLPEYFGKWFSVLKRFRRWALNFREEFQGAVGLSGL